jgi:hypothetical protein
VACANDATSPPCCAVSYVNFGTSVRYQVASVVETLGPSGEQWTTTIPVLQRIEGGGAAQVVARGVEDMQVEYVRADGTVSQSAPVVAQDDFNSIISQVRVTLVSRSLGSGTMLQGATTSATGMALRASLTSQGTPRAALMALAEADPATVPVAWD